MAHCSFQDESSPAPLVSLYVSFYTKHTSLVAQAEHSLHQRQLLLLADNAGSVQGEGNYTCYIRYHPYWVDVAWFLRLSWSTTSSVSYYWTGQAIKGLWHTH